MKNIFYELSPLKKKNNFLINFYSGFIKLKNTLDDIQCSAHLGAYIEISHTLPINRFAQLGAIYFTPLLKEKALNIATKLKIL
mgnify:CR=1 FL=1